MGLKTVVPSAEEVVFHNILTEDALMTLREGLGEKDFEVFVAHVLYETSISELAGYYEVNEKSIKNRLAKARRVINQRVESGSLGLER